jgi:hypothetical protein
VACLAWGGVVVICGRDVRDDNEGVVVRRLREGEGEMDAVDYFTEMGGDLR